MLTRVLYVLAAVFAVAGASVRIAGLPGIGRADAPAIDAAPVDAPPAARPSVPRARDDSIVAGNVFAARRTAPSARFIPADRTPAVVAPPLPRAVERPPLAVFGILITGGRTTALLDADPRIPGAEIYREGDILPGGGRVLQITAEQVVVDMPDGRHVLRLPSATRSTERPPLTP